MENIPAELQMLGLTQGANLPLEKVENEICPECPFKTPFCEFYLQMWKHLNELAGEVVSFVCKGMRYWVTRSN